MLRWVFWAILLPVAFASGPVPVEIYEALPKGEELQLTGREPIDRYTEPAFAFVRIPTRFSANAIPVDRSSPFVLRATYARHFAAGEHQFRLRARGAALLFLDGKEVARTRPQKPNTSGDDPVPPPPVYDASGRRPAPHPHQDEVAVVRLDAGEHRVELIAVIGGKGLMPTPGELAVAWGQPGAVERLLGPDTAPLLTDAEWDTYAAAAEKRHRDAEVTRRREASAEQAALWKQRHARVRAWLETQPAVSVPAVSRQMPVQNDIDRFLGARLEAAAATPTALAGDLEFLRRLSLDTTGLIPTRDQIRTFQKDPPAARRARAIERFLNDPGWADHWVSYWQDVLAENPGILKPDLNNTGPFRWWLHQSFRDDLPMDRFVTELVEMEGSIHQGAPAAFSQSTLNDAPMAAKADIVGRAFLGANLGCARCHDAPFHPVKQQNLFSLAAMLHGKPLQLPATSSVPLREGARKPAVQVTLKPGAEIAPEWPFPQLVDHAVDSAELPPSTALPSRRELARFIVSPENSRFAEVMANRIWARYMGAGIVDPVDDWARTRPSHPELLRYLAREFAANGYDTKHLARLIFSSHAYQRQAAPAEPGGAAKRLFRGPERRRMSAEQLVDSLHLAVGKPLACEELNLNPSGDRSPNQFLNMGKPERAWQMTALSNERDRPALALPIAQSLVDVLSSFGWRQSRQAPASTRDDAPSPMQTLILANGTLGARIVRLSDDSAITELALREQPLETLLDEMFWRVLSRPPQPEERRSFAELLAPYYSGRAVKDAQLVNASLKSDNRVSWSNHLSAEATLIRMEEERRLRYGSEPTKRLTPAFRERLEDVLWALVNTPEFVMVP